MAVTSNELVRGSTIYIERQVQLTTNICVTTEIMIITDIGWEYT